MSVSKKKRTTSETALSKSEPSCPLLPEQQEFHQHRVCLEICVNGLTGKLTGTPTTISEQPLT